MESVTGTSRAEKKVERDRCGSALDLDHRERPQRLGAVYCFGRDRASGAPGTRHLQAGRPASMSRSRARCPLVVTCSNRGRNWSSSSMTRTVSAIPAGPRLNLATITAVLYFFRRGKGALTCETRLDPDGPGFQPRDYRERRLSAWRPSENCRSCSRARARAVARLACAGMARRRRAEAHAAGRMVRSAVSEWLHPNSPANHPEAKKASFGIWGRTSGRCVRAPSPVCRSTFAPGEIVGLIGPNGVGKASALRCIAGIHRPTTMTRSGRRR